MKFRMIEECDDGSDDENDEDHVIALALGNT